MGSIFYLILFGKNNEYYYFWSYARKNETQDLRLPNKSKNVEMTKKERGVFGHNSMILLIMVFLDFDDLT